MREQFAPVGPTVGPVLHILQAKAGQIQTNPTSLGTFIQPQAQIQLLGWPEAVFRALANLAGCEGRQLLRRNGYSEAYIAGWGGAHVPQCPPVHMSPAQISLKLRNASNGGG